MLVSFYTGTLNFCPYFSLNGGKVENPSSFANHCCIVDPLFPAWMTIRTNTGKTLWKRGIMAEYIYSDDREGETIFPCTPACGMHHLPTLKVATIGPHSWRKTGELTSPNSRILSLEEDFLAHARGLHALNT